MIELKCPNCGRFLKMPQSFAGQNTTCPTCLKSVRVPGSAGPASTPTAPKPTGPAKKLCVDCGKAFPAGQMLTHNGQAVCTDCYHLRKPVVLKPRKKKNPRRRKIIVLVVVVAAVAVGGWAILRWVL